MDTRKPLDMFAVSLTVVLCLCFGLQQIVLKVTAPDMAPILQISLRSGLSALLVWLYMVSRGEKLSLLANGIWKPGLLAGVLFSLEYLLAGEALRYTSASRTTVFLYTSPIFAALGLHVLEKTERMAPLQWVGILLAFSGIALAFFGQGGSADAVHGHQMLGDFLALLAGASWGMTTVVIRVSRLAYVSAKQTLMYQLVAAFFLLLVSAVCLQQTAFTLTPRLVGSVVSQATLISFAAFLAWFWLLRHYQASRIGVLAFMTPLFGVVLGYWLLHDPLEPGFLQGAACVLLGIVLVSGYAWIGQGLRRLWPFSRFQA